MTIQLGDWPSWIMASTAVIAVVWGSALLAVQVRATAIIVKSMQPRIHNLERWTHDHDLEVKLRHEIEAEIRGK